MSQAVMMYHKVGAPDMDRFLNISTQSFARQMRTLKRLGYHAVTFADIAYAYHQHRSLPSKTFCITFDDGYECVGEYAAPILRELEWPATVFVPTQWAGKDNGWDEANKKRVLPLMGWDRLRELRAEGWEIAGHTRTHPRLAELPDDIALAEILQGKQAIQDQLGAPITTFCYPYGSLNARTPDLVKQAGYIAACTTSSGLASPTRNPYLLPRVKIAYRDGVAGMLYRMWIRPLMK